MHIDILILSRKSSLASQSKSICMIDLSQEVQHIQVGFCNHVSLLRSPLAKSLYDKFSKEKHWSYKIGDILIPLCLSCKSLSN